MTKEIFHSLAVFILCDMLLMRADYNFEFRKTPFQCLLILFFERTERLYTIGKMYYIDSKFR